MRKYGRKELDGFKRNEGMCQDLGMKIIMHQHSYANYFSITHHDIFKALYVKTCFVEG